MEKKYALLAFGCQMNLHDAERISGSLEAAGWREAPSEKEADAIILLTCCVRQSAEDRLMGRLHALKPLGGKGRAIIAVGGCLAQKEGPALMERAPHVGLVFGTHRYTDLPALLQEAGEGRVCATGMDGVRIAGTPMRRRDPWKAWVTITHGCDNYCSYCIVPLVRGREESRPLEEVLEEVALHVSEGVREVNLLGQNVNSYRRREEGRSSFPALLRRLGERFPDVWVRFTTSHPRDFDADTVGAIAGTHNVCEHVHLPLQAGSDRILEAMNRGYSGAEYLEKARLLRELVPGATLSTDLIVGFPGESEDDFLATLDMVERCRFDSAFTFLYNPRQGTAAARLPDDVPPAVKQDRLSRLMEAARRMTAASLEAEVGRDLAVLVHGPSRKDAARWASRTRNDKLLHFARDERDLAGRFAVVTVTAAGSWSLQGELREVLG